MDLKGVTVQKWKNTLIFKIQIAWLVLIVENNSSYELFNFEGDGLVIQHLPQPSHVFGVKLAIVHHAADVARLQVLSKYGGIYLGMYIILLEKWILF